MLDSVDAFALTADGHTVDAFVCFRLYIYGECRSGFWGREVLVSDCFVASSQ